jgi:phosphoenolpyruvate carboxykinase (GTP)
MGEAQAVETPVGLMPTYKDLNWEGLPHFSEEQFKELTSLDANKWETELASSAEFFAKFDGSIPEAFAVIQDDILKDFSSLKTPKTKTILTELSP